MTSPFSTELMQAIRSRFVNLDQDPIAGHRIFLESAGGSSPLASVVERTAQLIAIPDSGGRVNPTSEYLASLVHQGSDDVRRWLGAVDGRLVTAATGTDLLWRIVRTVMLTARAGPVTFSNLEHLATYDAVVYWARFTKRNAIEAHLDRATATVTAKEYTQTVQPDTALAVVIHTSNVTGKRVDLPEITRAIRTKAPECFIVCDGIQHIAHGPTDVASYDVDAYVFSPYKAYSRRGGAFAWLSSRLAELPHEQQAGSHIDDWDLGGRDASMYAGQSETLRYLCWLGAQFTNSRDKRQQSLAAMGAIARHEECLIKSLLFGTADSAGLSDLPGVHLIGGTELDDRESAVSFVVRDRPSAEVVAGLEERGIRVHFRSMAYSGNTLAALDLHDCIRVSFCHYNTSQEITALLQALANFL